MSREIFPHRPRPKQCSPRHRAPVAYEEAFWFCSGSLSHELGSSRERRGYLGLPSQQFHLPDGDDVSRHPKLTSEAVAWWQPWFYVRLVVYSFLGLSEGA